MCLDQGYAQFLKTLRWKLEVIGQRRILSCLPRRSCGQKNHGYTMYFEGCWQQLNCCRGPVNFVESPNVSMPPFLPSEIPYRVDRILNLGSGIWSRHFRNIIFFPINSTFFLSSFGSNFWGSWLGFSTSVGFLQVVACTKWCTLTRMMLISLHPVCQIVNWYCLFAWLYISMDILRMFHWVGCL